jgi:pSer/pThr/pTyr-binding forkhead associated (FHA) protein
MKTAPSIDVQLIHIAGPLKGTIQDFSGDLITVGRLPSCSLRFPADLVNLSRTHAEIVRDGNTFRLIDRSRNGTFVNGKRVAEAALRTGDILEFSEGGPKVSFLMHIREADDGRHRERTVDPAGTAGHHLKESPAPASSEGAEIPARRISAPLVIQYGPSLKIFRELPVCIGTGRQCDFMMNSHGLFDQHLQIFHDGKGYRIKDLTGCGMVHLNGVPIPIESPLNAGDELWLSVKGPFFRFLGDGRLAESGEVVPASPESGMTGRSTDPAVNVSGGLFSKLKKKFLPGR